MIIDPSNSQPAIHNSHEYAIKVENLSKAYKLYNNPVDRMKESLHPLRKKYHHDFYALNDVSFDVKKGETVGIIGKNGSGKSTLLKIITGVLTPTSGSVQVNGKVSALLELGAGFNPEFTGIENVYFNGSIMGYSKAEMDEKIDDILSFADIGEFIYQPVKVYSSGMFVRLAFSVAVNVEPDIFIVDEALSVGDMFFQQKCILRMRKMMDNGVTTLFVSHDPGTIQSLCNRGVLLQNGLVKMIGDAKDVSFEYLKQMHDYQNDCLQSVIEEKKQIDNIKEYVDDSLTIRYLSKDDFIDGGMQFQNKLSERFGENTSWIKNVKIINSEGEITNVVQYKESFTVRIYIEAKDNLEGYCVGVRLWDDKGMSLAGTTNTIEIKQLPSLRVGEQVIYDFSFKNIFAAGVYSVSAGIETVVVLNQNHFVLDAVIGAEVFQISPPEVLTSQFLTKVYTPISIRAYNVKID